MVNCPSPDNLPFTTHNLQGDGINMKLSYEWLKEYVDTGVNAEKLAHMLTMSGSAVEAVKDAEGTKVLELEITSNRPDCLNIIGLAREAAAVFGKKLKTPPLSAVKGNKSGHKFECVIKAKDLCPRYTARVITGVSVKPSAAEISKRLAAVSLRPINNVVDITNYCLMELGQPMHAFDLNKIRGGKVIVRRAAKNEKIVTIDGVERTLDESMLVIADAERAIAVAGVMGGKDTEVTESTKNVLLESAYFDPISIRRTARKLALSSDSSYRFERGVDKGMVKPASDRATRMIVESAGGVPCEFYDEGKAEPAKVTVKFDVARAERTLGVKLGEARVKKIFKSLGVTVSNSSGEKLQLAVPSFREDLEREIDLVEEVARIYGYDNIPSDVSKLTPQGERKEKARRVDEKIRAMLAGYGLSEIVTYSLTNKKAAEMFPSLSGQSVQLANPLSEEQRYLVPQLLDGMMRVVSWNINRKNKNLALFEVAKTYSRSGDSEKDIKETPALSIGMTGAARKNWKEGEIKAGFYDLKGAIEAVFAGLRTEIEFTEVSLQEFSAAAEIRAGKEKKVVGVMGEVASAILAAFDIHESVYAAQIALDEAAKLAVLEDSYSPIPRFPFSSRDVSMLCDKAIASAEIKRAIEDLGGEIVKKVELLDLYQGDKLPAGKKSLTYTIDYGRQDRTLTDEEVEGAHSAIKQAVADRFGVTFR